MVHLRIFPLFPLLLLATARRSNRGQDRHASRFAPEINEALPVTGSDVENYGPVGPQRAEYPMGPSSDVYHHESGPTCGQRYGAESADHVVASSTKSVTWTPLLRDITLGLRALDFDKSTNVRVKADANNVKPDGATIDVTTWHDTKMYWADANYISWGSCDKSLETGVLDTYKEGTRSKKVKFDRCYAVPPTVVVFFYYLDLPTGGDAYRVTAYAEDVTTQGFTVGARTWSSSQLYAAGVGWIVVPASSTVFRAGTYSTSELHHYTQPAQKHSKTLSFSSPIRDNAQIFTALNHIDINNAQNLRIQLKEEAVSGKGFTWHIDAWSDTQIFSAGASYLAY